MVRLAPLLAALTACYASHGTTDETERPLFDSAVDPIDGGPLDGGPIVEGPVLTSCAEATMGREGQRCSFDEICRTRDLCLDVSLGCGLGRLFIEERSERAGAYDLGECTLSTGMAGVTGTTPAGPIDLAMAWASHSHAFAVDAVLVAHEFGGGATCGTDRLGLWIQPTDGRSYLGVHEVPVLITTGELGPTVVPGTFEVVESGDAPFIEGNLTVDHGEWQLSGFIAAEPCDAIDRSGP